MNIYVSNLSFAVQDEDLRGFFEEYGEVSSAKVIMDKATGRSKGYGFVELEDNAAGQKAIEELNGAEYDGRTISVSEARPRTEGGDRPRRNFDNNRGGNGGFRRREY